MPSQNAADWHPLTAEEIVTASPEKLFRHFRSLARSEARRVKPDDEDVLAEAYFGLWNAARTFDSTKGTFAAWAALIIKKALSRREYLNTHIRLSYRVRSRLTLVLAARDVCEARVGGPPPVEMIAYETGETVEEVEWLLSLPHTVSLPQNEDDLHDIEIIDALDPELVEATNVNLDVQQLLRALPDELRQEVDLWLSSKDGSQKKLRQIAAKCRKLMRNDGYQAAMRLTSDTQTNTDSVNDA